MPLEVIWFFSGCGGVRTRGKQKKNKEERERNNSDQKRGGKRKGQECRKENIYNRNNINIYIP